MRLRVLLPSRVFLDVEQVVRVVAQGTGGSFGLLPNRRDCVAALAPGILTYQTDQEGEEYAAVDEGILVKAGSDVTVTTRNAVAGTELGRLHEAVEQEFRTREDAERNVRTVLATLESSFIRRYMELRRP
jgi:F-type H+-transporting ATPase subunit epsilon